MTHFCFWCVHKHTRFLFSNVCTQDEHECIRASLGFGTMRSRLPISRTVALLHRFGSHTMTPQILLDKMFQICEGEERRGNGGSLGWVGGEEGWVRKQDFTRVFKLLQREQRIEEERKGVLLMGFRMRNQLIERPGVLHYTYMYMYIYSYIYIHIYINIHKYI